MVFTTLPLLRNTKNAQRLQLVLLGSLNITGCLLDFAIGPAMYQRLMAECFEVLHLKICLFYLDDIIIFSHSFDEHLDRLAQVFQRIRESGQKLAPSRCSLFKERIKFLGHVFHPMV